MIAKFKFPYRVLLLVSLCLLLCACQTDKSPQQLLAEQVIDDTHDAFLVDTGGKMGTLLVTAELAEESKNEFGTRDITFSVWNPAEMEQPIQIFTKESIFFGWHEVEDANFDGYMDFGYLFHAGNQPNYWHYWLWDEERAQFIYCEPLLGVSQPMFDADRQIVTGWARSSAASGTNTYYRWIDEELVLVRKIEHEFLSEYIEWAAVEDSIDGQMVEVYRNECEVGTPEHDEMLKWYDLDYHGEP